MPAVDLILGRYEPLAEVGRGASGRVLHALDTKLKRDVAIKCIHIPRTTACNPSAPRGSVSETQGASGVLSAVQDSSQSDESLMRCVPSRLIYAQVEPAQNSMCSEPPSTPSASLGELAYENLPRNSAADAGVDTTPSRNAPVAATPLRLCSGYCDNTRCMASKGCAASDGTPVSATEFPSSDTPSASLGELGLDSGEPASPSPVQAALEEARTTAKLKAANIVTVYDFALSGDTAYVVMEYIDGVTLADVLAQLDDDITLDVIAAVVKGVGAALNAAHKQGVLHLDIKPQNVLIDATGQVKVADFGMSALMDAAGVGYAAGGTIGYMPPEQLRMGELDARTDEWALASLAYEMLVGENPFKVDNLKQAVSKIEGAELVVPSLCWDDSDPFIDDVIFAALDPRPEARYDTVADFVTELLPLVGSPKEGRAQLAGAVADAIKAAEASADSNLSEAAGLSGTSPGLANYATGQKGPHIIQGTQAAFDFDPNFDADGDFDPAIVATFADQAISSEPSGSVHQSSKQSINRVVKRVTCVIGTVVMIACCLLNVHIGGLLDVAPASEVSGAAYGLFSDLPYVAWAIAGVFAVIAVFAPVYASAISVAAFCVVGALNACFVDPMPYASIIAWVVQGFAFAGAMRDAKKKRRRGFFSWVYLVFAVAAAVSLLVVPLFWPSLPAIQYGPGLIIVCAVVMVLMFACAF